MITRNMVPLATVLDSYATSRGKEAGVMNRHFCRPHVSLPHLVKIPLTFIIRKGFKFREEIFIENK